MGPYVGICGKITLYMVGDVVDGFTVKVKKILLY